MLTIDPIVAFDLDPIRLPEATYRQQQRRRLLLEIDLSDDKQLELDGTMIARNDVIETFKLLDDPDVREYLDVVHASWHLRELWIDGYADAEGVAELKLSWASLIRQGSHKYFRSRWRSQWKATLKAAFDERVDLDAFDDLIDCCEADRELGATCYQKITDDVQSLETEIEAMIEEVEAGEVQQNDVESLIADEMAIELIGRLPLSCNGTKTSLAQVLRNLSVALHNADVVDNTPVQVLELAFRVVSKCEVAPFYNQELDSLIAIRESNQEWERINDFGTRLRAVIKKIEDGASRSSISDQVQAIEAEATEVADLANTLTSDEETGGTFRDGMANAILVLSVLVYRRYSAPQCAANLAASAATLKGSEEITKQIREVAASISRQEKDASRHEVIARTKSKAIGRNDANINATTNAKAWIGLALLAGITLVVIFSNGSKNESTSVSSSSQTANKNVWPSSSQPAKTLASFPYVTGLYGDSNSELVIDNQGQSRGVTAMVKSGNRGKQFHINGWSQESVEIPNGRYQIYFIYDEDPYSLYQGDSFGLEQNEQITLVLREQVGGNYNVRKIE